MKRIKFISPIEEMSGNLSGAQNLKYPTQDNKAFESPEGSVNYARNYKTRFIGAVRRKDGLCYFSVKTKTATHITTRSLMAMALLGGAGAMYAALVRTKTSSIYNNIYAQWLELNNIGNTKSFREFVMDIFRQALAEKKIVITITGPRGAITVNNPWRSNEQTEGVAVSNQILAKFWVQLSLNGIAFTIDGVKVVSEENYQFSDLIAMPVNSSLTFTKDEDGYILLNGRYVLNPSGQYVDESAEPIPNGKYTTTDIAPE